MNENYIIEGEPDEEFPSNIPRKTLGKHIWEYLIKHDPETLAEVRTIHIFPTVTITYINIFQ